MKKQKEKEVLDFCDKNIFPLLNYVFEGNPLPQKTGCSGIIHLKSRKVYWELNMKDFVLEEKK